MGKTPAFVMRGERLGHFLSALPPYPALRVRYGGSALTCSGLKPLRPSVAPRGQPCDGAGATAPRRGPLPRFSAYALRAIARLAPLRAGGLVCLLTPPVVGVCRQHHRLALRGERSPPHLASLVASVPKGAPHRLTAWPMPGRSFLSATAYHCSLIFGLRRFCYLTSGLGGSTGLACQVLRLVSLWRNGSGKALAS